MRLCVTQNALQLPLFFFFPLFLELVLDGLTKVFQVTSISFSCRHVWPRSRVLYWTHWQVIHRKIKFVYVLKFRMWENSMSCALEINHYGECKQGHVKYCPWTTTNISPLPECMWPPNLAGWWITASFPTHKMTWLFPHVVFLDHVTN